MKLVTFAGLVESARVHDHPTPRDISYGGGVVTIYGEGFSADTFSQFNSTKGNKARRVTFKFGGLFGQTVLLLF